MSGLKLINAFIPIIIVLSKLFKNLSWLLFGMDEVDRPIESVLLIIYE